LLSSLLGHPVAGVERTHAARTCRAVGHLPLGIEAAASAVRVDGIPLALLAERTALRLLASQRELRSGLVRSLEAVGAEAQHRFALLPLLGSGAFDLAAAASLGVPADQCLLPLTLDKRDSEDTSVESPAAHLATTAADLGQLVRHSLLDLTPEPPAPPPTAAGYDDRGLGPRYALHPLLHAWAWERSQRLDPEVMAAARGYLQAYALTFLERHTGASDRIVRERGVLLVALAHARRTCQHAVVLRLAAGLIGVEGRLGSYEQAVQVLCWGLRASRHEHDPYTAARLLNRLGRLLLYHGDVERARRVWDESLRNAEALRHPVFLWHPLGNLALLAGLYGEYEAAQTFANAYHDHASSGDDGDMVAVTLSRRGMCARMRGAGEAAYDDLSGSLRLLERSSPAFSRRHAVEAEVRLELARLHASYPETQRQVEEAEAYTQDNYGLADMLSEQASFAYELGAIQDARALVRRAATVARKSEAHFLYARSANLLRKLN